MGDEPGTTVATTTKAPRICEVGAESPLIFMNGGNSGVFLPLGGDAEARLPDWLQAIFYLVALLYMFAGVSLLADKFMCAIEKVTSKKKIKKIHGREVTIRQWNPTCANLTLMALGSSAPEILLSVIELLSNKMFSGELGPSTIVGSAAFNLLVITAICISSLPEGEMRQIRELNVFIVTASFSVFAYIWLLFIIMGSTPDTITVAEGVVTFLFFFVLVGIAYIADKGYFPRVPGHRRAPRLSNVSTEAERREMETTVRDKYGRLSDEEAALLMAHEFAEPQSRATHRINATRGIFRHKKVSVYPDRQMGASLALHKGADIPILGFRYERYGIVKSKGSVTVTVTKKGGIGKGTVKVFVNSRKGTAVPQRDFEELRERLEFEEHELEKTVTVKLASSTKASTVGRSSPSDSSGKPLEFYLDLKSPDMEDASLDAHRKTTTVDIIEKAAETGKIKFSEEHVHIKAKYQDFDHRIKVVRTGCEHEEVRCTYFTEEDSATKGKDYQDIQDKELVFAPGVKEVEIVLNIMKQTRGERDEKFRVYLKDVKGNAKFDETGDGGKDKQAICTVYIDSVAEDRVDKVLQKIPLNWDHIGVGTSNWKGQFVDVFHGWGEEGVPPSCFNWVMHIIILPWKLFVACVPPDDYCEGWVCFFSSLFFIGIVTAVIGDLANLLGCAVNMSASTTAITIVALGTSLPDTFASRTAALQDSTADNCIGNVTGSNSVNVFLGLGLPWMVGAIYWEYVVDAEPGGSWYQKAAAKNWPESILNDNPKGVFVVMRGSLGVSVAIFSCCSVLALGLLVIRRKVAGCELGGSYWGTTLSSLFLVSLWLVYLCGAIAYDECCADK